MTRKDDRFDREIELLDAQDWSALQLGEQLVKEGHLRRGLTVSQLRSKISWDVSELRKRGYNIEQRRGMYHRSKNAESLNLWLLHHLREAQTRLKLHREYLTNGAVEFSNSLLSQSHAAVDANLVAAIETIKLAQQIGMAGTPKRVIQRRAKASTFR